MNKDALWLFVRAMCAIVCVACPLVIVWFGQAYGYDRLRSDDDYRSWRVSAIDALFLLAICSTGGFIVSMRRWWWLAALISLPLLCLTGVLAFTCGAWVEGTYF